MEAIGKPINSIYFKKNYSKVNKKFIDKFSEMWYNISTVKERTVQEMKNCNYKKNDMGKYVEDIYNKKTLKKVQKKKNRAANKNWKMFTEN